MMKIIKSLVYFLLSIILISCASLDKQNSYPVLSHEDLTGTNIYLIGDAGLLDNNNPSAALKALQRKLALSDEKDVLLFLGDNIYPKGMPADSTDKHYVKSRKSLEVQLNAAESFKGKVIFIPGNHDWYSGLDGLKQEQKLVEKSFGKNSFLPKNGCPLDYYKVSDDLVIITVDSEWYLTDWNKHPKINDDCKIKSREKFIEEFKSLVNKNQRKQMIIAIHHPLDSFGSHGGYYAFNPLKVPFNILRRASGVSPADNNFPLYRELSNKITTILQEYKENTIVVSGHDHNLQYFKHKNIPQIISGSGSKITPVRHFKNTDDVFTFGGAGYAVVNIQNKKQRILFYDSNNNLIYSNNIRFNKNYKFEEKQDFLVDSIEKASIYPLLKRKKSGLYNFFFGKHYRDLYYKKFSFPVINLDTMYGGLKPVKLGGGNQTVSLRLIDKKGKEYALRRLRKSASQFIQVKAYQEEYVKDQLDDTLAENFLMDFYTTAYPFASLITNKLAKIVGVFHTNPQIIYLPKQKALERYNDKIGDDLYMIEERPSEEFSSLKSFGNSDGIISTDKVLLNLMKDEKYKIDHEQYIKTRLFDMWLGDWDRHEDQYRWAEYENKKGTITYAPIPRDRDQAFSKLDGLFIDWSTRLFPPFRLMQSFDDDIRNIRTFNQVIYKLDKAIINKSSEKEWLDAAAYLEERLTDEAIEKVYAELPKEIKDQNAKEIFEHLKNRRKHIINWAKSYFKILSRNLIVTGTDKDDLFEITRLENGNVHLKVTRLKKEISENDVLFDRILTPDYTKEIWLYGLDDKDHFIVKGNHKPKIKIKIIGGQNKDTYTILNPEKIKVYDYKSKESFFEGDKIRAKLTDDYETNNYNINKYKYNVGQILPLLEYNPDDGVIIGTNNHLTKYGFKANPFSEKHSLGIKFYTATSGYEFNYKAEFAEVFGKTNFRLETRYTTPAYSLNFFGFGNQTENREEELEIEHYRTRLEQFNAKISLVQKGRIGYEWNISIPFDHINPNENDNRFVEQYFPLESLKPKKFIGVETAFVFQNKNNQSFSTLGMEFDLTLGWKTNMDDNKRNFSYLSPALQIDYPIIKDSKLTLSTLWKAQFLSNSNYEFYQSSSIGGKNGVRGFRNHRFSGKNSYFQNTDLRFNLSKFNSGIVPGNIGVFSGFDYGRVWYENESSEKWHASFGGGVYLNSKGLFTLQTSYFTSDDGGRFLFNLGFGF